MTMTMITSTVAMTVHAMITCVRHSYPCASIFTRVMESVTATTLVRQKWCIRKEHVHQSHADICGPCIVPYRKGECCTGHSYSPTVESDCLYVLHKTCYWRVTRKQHWCTSCLPAWQHLYIDNRAHNTSRRTARLRGGHTPVQLTAEAGADGCRLKWT